MVRSGGGNYEALRTRSFELFQQSSDAAKLDSGEAEGLWAAEVQRLNGEKKWRGQWKNY